MPNHAYQRVRLTGDSRIVMRLHNEVPNRRFCDAVIPMPLELMAGDGWYGWCVEHWDTKWDICSPEIIATSWGEGSELSSYFGGDEHWFEFTCWTAWSPPYAIWHRLMELGICVEAEYFDEGGHFVGTWRDGVMEEWQVDDDWEATCKVTERCVGEADYFVVEED